MYWDETENDWGKPNQKHYSRFDVKETNGVVDDPIVPTDDYNLRYAKYNKADLCDTNFPVSFLIHEQVLF